jgi:dipeptidyl aminopeptidase/acylaminoacyl peptidase
VACTPRPRALALSPDGDHAVLVLDGDGYGDDLWVLDARGGAPERLTTDRAVGDRHGDPAPSWSPDGTRVAFVDRGAARVVPVPGGPAVPVTDALSAVWLDGDTLVVTVLRDGAVRLATVALADPWPRPLGRRDGDYADVAVAPGARLVAATFCPLDDPNRVELHLLDVTSGDVRAVTGAPDVADTQPTWSPDGSSVLFVSDRTGWRELHLLELDGAGPDSDKALDAIGVSQRHLTADGADFAEPCWSGRNARIVATHARAGAADVVAVDADTGWVEVVAAGGTWSRPQWRDATTVIGTHESETSPPAVVTIEHGGGAPKSLLSPAPRAVHAATYVRASTVSYPSEDGTVIHARLLRPRDASAARPAPVVVAVHGGPSTCAGDEWDGLAQYFVEKGYGWLAPNYRGSTGYGRTFERAGRGVRGLDDVGDCLFAGEYLAKLEWVDEERIAIVGRSYGGFLALGTLTRDPEHRFAAGVSLYGDCDLFTTWSTCTRGRRRDIEAAMGHPSAYHDAYNAGSPINRVDAIGVPLLVVHGEEDDVVPVEQARELVAELRRLDKPFEHVTYRAEGHGFAHASTRLDFAQRLEQFLDWHLM